MDFSILAQVDPVKVAGELSKDAGAWPAYVAVALAVAIVFLFGTLVRVMLAHKAETKADGEAHSAEIRSLKDADVAARNEQSRQIDTLHQEHRVALNERDKRQAEVWEKFVAAIQPR